MVDSGNNPKQLRQPLPRRLLWMRPTLLVERPEVQDAIVQLVQSAAAFFRGTPSSQTSAPESNIPPQPSQEPSGRKNQPHSTTLIAKVKKEYYLLDEAAKELQHSPVTLWRWIKSGKLRAEYLGRNVLIAKSDVERLR